MSRAWPITVADQEDASFSANPPPGVPPAYIQDWQARRICGCGDQLEPGEAQNDGICGTCRDLGTRTPRPPFVVQFKGRDIPVHPFWIGFWHADMLKELQRIESLAGDDFTPGPERVLRFLATGNVRCVILGQDPYPQPGAATGRAFEVAGVESWRDKAVNASLKNILKLLHRTHHRLDQAKAIEAVRTDTDFPILPPGQLFTYWESRGVLLLNTALTCRVGVAGSHKAHWRRFTESLIGYIAERAPDAAWLLWGAEAVQYRSLLSATTRIHQASHPSSRDGSFLRSTCFADTADLVAWVDPTAE